MLEASAMPILRRIAPGDPAFEMRTWRISGLGESEVEDSVGESLLRLEVELGYCARPGEVDVRVIGARQQLAAAEEIISAKLAPHIVSEDSRSLEKVVVDLLTDRGERVGTAESCTGGYLAHRITNVPGASEAFVEGFITYANDAKIDALGVDPALIREFGAVSHQVAAAMAAGVLEKSDVHYALATTGIAGPGGGTPEKPVGTVYIAIRRRGGGGEVVKHRFSTDRETFKDLVAQTALDLLRRWLTQKGRAYPALSSISTLTRSRSEGET
jgi:nicotinamide-nucleotide amidase